MEIIHNQDTDIVEINPILGYCTALFIFFGLNIIFNYLRPIVNLYTMYFSISWAEFQILEIFNILNMILGILLAILGMLLLNYKEFTRKVLLVSGIVFLLYILSDPSHFLMVGNLLATFLGTPPLWMQAIPGDILTVYLSAWSLISISNVLLQVIGFYIAIRISMNVKPKKSLTQYLFFYCWVMAVSGLVLCLQAVIVPSLAASWSSIAVGPFILHFVTWISMIALGISGLLYLTNDKSHDQENQTLKFGQISLVSFSLMHLLISYSDFPMKTPIALAINTVISAVILIFAFKLPKLLKEVEMKGI